MAKYDDAAWHLARGFPDDIPSSAAATHIGMFFGWAVERGLASPDLEADFPEAFAQFRSKESTGPQLFLACCDGKLTDDDLSDEGARFASDYYDQRYFDDYVETAMTSDDASVFHVPDDRPTFERVASMLDQRLEEWRREQKA